MDFLKKYQNGLPALSLGKNKRVVNGCREKKD
jgi:hypothetical protein